MTLSGCSKSTPRKCIPEPSAIARLFELAESIRPTAGRDHGRKTAIQIVTVATIGLDGKFGKVRDHRSKVGHLGTLPAHPSVHSAQTETRGRLFRSHGVEQLLYVYFTLWQSVS
jgi:hypothetical protein